MNRRRLYGGVSALVIGAISLACAVNSQPGGPHRPHAAVPAPPPAVVARPAVLEPVATALRPAAVLREDRIEINQSIEFEFDADRIRPESSDILDQVAGVLRAHPEIRRLRVEGYTDNRGTPQHNQDLSTRRAAAVVAYLRAHGVTTAVDSAGFGSSRPVCTEDNDACHQRNRRVDFVVVNRVAVGS